MVINNIVIKGYKNLTDIKLKFKDSSTYVLIGNNGSGKSKYSKYFMSKNEFVEALLEKFEIMGEMIK